MSEDEMQDELDRESEKARKIVRALRDAKLIDKPDDIAAVAMATGMFIGMWAAAQHKAQTGKTTATEEHLPWIQKTLDLLGPLMLHATAHGKWADDSLRRAIMDSGALEGGGRQPAYS